MSLLHCQKQDRDVPRLKCGYPLPCPHHAGAGEVPRSRAISSETQSISRGALTLEVAALRVGDRWTDSEIERCWDALSAVFGAFSRPVMMRNAHLYLVDNFELNDPLYIGATVDGPPLTTKAVAKLRKNGMRTIEEVLSGDVAPSPKGYGFVDRIKGRKVGKPDRRAVERRAKPRRVSDRSRLATGKRHKR